MQRDPFGHNRKGWQSELSEEDHLHWPRRGGTRLPSFLRKRKKKRKKRVPVISGEQQIKGDAFPAPFRGGALCRAGVSEKPKQALKGEGENVLPKQVIRRAISESTERRCFSVDKNRRGRVGFGRVAGQPESRKKGKKARGDSPELFHEHHFGGGKGGERPNIL